MNKVRSYSKLVLGIAIISSLLLQSCSKKIGVFRSSAAKNVKVEKFDFNYLTIKSKIELKETHKSTNATALIRMKKDSVIWFNLSGALGVQGMRGIITQDSVKVINKVDKIYYVYDFKEISKEFDFPIDFDLIQAMLVGDMPKPMEEDNFAKSSGKRYIVKQNIDDILITNYINKESLKLEEVNVIEKETDNSLKLLYKDFREINSQGLPFTLFASLIHHNEFGELETQLNVEVSKVEASDKPIKFPFSVPKKYETK